MTRLENQQKKNYFRQIIFLSILILFFLFFLFTYGLKFIVNISLFLANLSHPQRNINYSKSEIINEFLLPPEIYNIPTATNSSNIKINGKAESGKKLLIFVNGQIQHDFDLQDDFFETEITLEPSENLIYLVIKDPKTNKKRQSDLYKVVYKNKKPELAIISPENNSKVTQEEIKIEGKTEKEVFVKINNNPVVVNADGQFSYLVRLQQGENKFMISASDIAGNEEQKELTINYQKDE